jgi:hypothetical protein
MAALCGVPRTRGKHIPFSNSKLIGIEFACWSNLRRKTSGVRQLGGRAQVERVGFANDGQRNSLFRRPPTCALAAFKPHKPAVCFRRSEQASIAVAAVGILEELT